MKSKLAYAFLSVSLGAFGILSAAWFLVCLVRAEYLSALVSLGAAVFSFGMIIMLVIVATGNVTPRVQADGVGLVVRPDRHVDALLTVSIVSCFIAMVLYAIFSPLGMLDIRGPRDSDTYFLIPSAIGAVVGVFSLRQLIRQRGTSLLMVSEDGLHTGNTMTVAAQAWNEVADIADRPPKGGRPNGATYIVTADGHTRELPSAWYTPGGQALHAWLRFYWQHPESRDELTDGRALRRLEAEF